MKSSIVEQPQNSCIECHNEPVHVKKRQLGKRCYARFKSREHRKGRGILSKNHVFCPSVANKRENKGEIIFIKNYFDHQNWTYSPAKFYLNGTSYSPDFYDGERRVFIEVSATRQAYHENKSKYALFRQTFPGLPLEVRKPSGELLDETGRLTWE